MAAAEAAVGCDDSGGDVAERRTQEVSPASAHL